MKKLNEMAGNLQLKINALPMNKIGMFAFVFFLFITSPFIRIKAQTLSLDSMLNRVERNNPALLSYHNRRDAANELVKGAKAFPAPVVGVELDDNPYFGFPPGVIRLSISQEIPNNKELNAKEDYLKSLAGIDVKQGEYLKYQYFYAAKQAYFKRYITEKTIDILQENINILKVMIDIGEKQLAISNRGDLGGIYKLKARLADMETMLVREGNMVKSLTVEVNYLMNEDLNQNFSLDTNNILKDYRSHLLIKDSIQYIRSDIQKMNNEISSMKLNQTMMSFKAKPMYGVRARHFVVTGMPDMYSLEAMMTIPIAPWSSKGYKSEVKSMDFEIAAMEQDKQAMINMAENMIRMLLIEMNSKNIEVENYKTRVVPAYKKSLEANLLSYRQNTNDLNFVLMAWDDLQMAQVEYVQRIGALLKIQAEYEREMQIR